MSEWEARYPSSGDEPVYFANGDERKDPENMASLANAQAAEIERLRDGLKTIRDTCDEPQGGKGIEVLHKLIGVVIPNLCDETLDDDEPMNERGPAAGYQ